MVSTMVAIHRFSFADALCSIHLRHTSSVDWILGREMVRSRRGMHRYEIWVVQCLVLCDRVRTCLHVCAVSCTVSHTFFYNNASAQSANDSEDTLHFPDVTPAKFMLSPSWRCLTKEAIFDTFCSFDYSDTRFLLQSKAIFRCLDWQTF